MMKRQHPVLSVAAIILFLGAGGAYAVDFQDGLKRPQILWISPPGPAEAMGNSIRCDITYFRPELTDLDLHHLTDKPLEEEKKVCDALQERNGKYLCSLIDGLKEYDVLVLAVNPQKFDAGLQSKIVSWVNDGGKLIYYPPHWEIIFKPENPLAGIMPVRPGEYKFKAWNVGQFGATDNPLVRGLPIELIGDHFYGPIYEPADAACEALTVEKPGSPRPHEKIARFWTRKIGEKGGEVVFLSASPFAQKHQWGSGSYASYEQERPGDRAVWIGFFKRLFYSLSCGEKAFPVLLDIKKDETLQAEPGRELDIQVAAENMLADKTVELELELNLSSPRTGGIQKISKPLLLKQKEKVSVPFKLQLPKALPLERIMVSAMSKDKVGGAVISDSWTWIPVRPAVEIILESAKVGFLSGEKIPVSVRFGKLGSAEMTAKAFLVDFQGGILQQATFDGKLPENPSAWDFSFVMPKDLDGSKYAYWITACVFDAGALSAVKRLQVYNDDPWDMRRQFQFSLWSAGVNADSIRLYEDAGFNSLGYGGSPYWAEKKGWRRYDEGTGIDTFGVCIDHDNWADVEKAMKKTIDVQNKNGPNSRSLALVSLGEESGFKGGWGTRYYWDGDQAPAIPQKVFDDYLKELYKDKIADLNESWGSNYTSFSEIPLTKKYSVGPRLITIAGQNYPGDSKEKEWKLDVDVANISAEKKYVAKTAPYFETYAFYDWYYQKYCDLATDVFRKNRNSSARTIMSAPGGFYPKVDVFNFDGIGPFHAKERASAENAKARLEYGDIPGFSGALWAYFDLERLWRSEIFSYVAAGNTHIDYWVDFPLTFNNDLSHTRASFWTKKFMHAIRRLEPLLLHKKVYYTPGLGIFTGKQLIPKGLAGQYFNAGVSPNVEPYSAMEESGYFPRFVKAEELSDIKVLFCSYAQLVTSEEAAKLKEFVERGGLLITTPWMASSSEHKNLLSVYPAEETELDRLFGFKLLHSSQLQKKVPLKIDPSDSIQLASGIEINSFGQDKVLDMAGDVKVLAEYQDKSPAILGRQVGKGMMIYFNFIYCWSGWWNTFYEPQREAYRRLVKAIIEKDGRVKSEFFISYKSHDPKPQKGWWGTIGLDKLGTWKPGDSVPYWAAALYTDPTGTNKYLFVFSDHRAPKIDAELSLPHRDSVVFASRGSAILAGMKKLEHDQNGNLPLSIDPGGGTVLAIVKDPPQKIGVEVPEEVKAGTELAVELKLKSASSDVVADFGILLDTAGPDGEYDEFLSASNWTVSRGSGTLKMPVPLNQKPGKYTIVAMEQANAGLCAERNFNVVGPPEPLPPRELIQPFPPDTELSPVPPMTPDEFVQELVKLRKVYLTQHTGLDAKYYLDFFLYVPFIKDTRHHIMHRLSKQNWKDYVHAVGQALHKGEAFYLTGEDMGVDPRSGMIIDGTVPLRKDFLGELSALNDAKSAKVKVAGREMSVVSIGSGKLVYDPVSLQELYMSEDFEAWQKGWLASMREAVK